MVVLGFKYFLHFLKSLKFQKNFFVKVTLKLKYIDKATLELGSIRS